MSKPEVTILNRPDPDGMLRDDLFIYIDGKIAVTHYADDADFVDDTIKLLLAKLGIGVKTGKYRDEEDWDYEREPTTVEDDVDGPLEDFK